MREEKLGNATASPSPRSARRRMPYSAALERELVGLARADEELADDRHRRRRARAGDRASTGTSRQPRTRCPPSATSRSITVSAADRRSASGGSMQTATA